MTCIPFIYNKLGWFKDTKLTVSQWQGKTFSRDWFRITVYLKHWASTQRNWADIFQYLLCIGPFYYSKATHNIVVKTCTTQYLSQNNSIKTSPSAFFCLKNSFSVCMHIIQTNKKKLMVSIFIELLFCERYKVVHVLTTMLCVGLL